MILVSGRLHRLGKMVSSDNRLASCRAARPPSAGTMVKLSDMTGIKPHPEAAGKLPHRLGLERSRRGWRMLMEGTR
jgi:hypothetical protein